MIRTRLSRRWSLANCVCLLCLAPALLAQKTQPPAAETADVPVIRVSSELVLVDALVANQKTGKPIAGLTPEDFQITEDGAPQQIAYLSQESLPLSIVFLFDLTETVRPVLTSLAQGASMILNHLKPQDEVAVMVFSSHTELVQGFTTRRIATEYAIHEAADRTTTEGTFIYEDMFEAIDEAMQSTAPQGRRVLVWLTDGTANIEGTIAQSRIGKQAPARLHTRQQATDKLQHSGVVVAALIQRSQITDALLGTKTTRPADFMANTRLGDIEGYADLTGGPVLQSTNRSATAQMSELLDQLRSRYTLGYRPAAEAPHGKFSKIRVTLTQQAFDKHPEWRKSDIVVRARSGYYR